MSNTHLSLSLHHTTLLLTLQYKFYSSRIITRQNLRSQFSKELHMLRVKDGFNNKFNCRFLEDFIFSRQWHSCLEIRDSKYQRCSSTETQERHCWNKLACGHQSNSCTDSWRTLDSKKLLLKVKCKTAHSSSPDIGNVWTVVETNRYSGDALNSTEVWFTYQREQQAALQHQNLLLHQVHESLVSASGDMPGEKHKITPTGG